VVAGLLAMLAFLVATGESGGKQVAVAARGLAAGEPLSPGDFRYINARLPDATLTAMLRPADVGAISGKVTTHAIAEGEPVTTADVAAAAAPSQQRSMSIPIDPSHAVSGSLQRGDAVDVVDSSSGDSLYVVTDARVLAVGAPEGDKKALAGSPGKYAVTIAVDERSALRVAQAITGGKVDVVRATGAPPAAPSPVPTTSTTVRR
jgi:Flp pilus assembly protein CpaB